MELVTGLLGFFVAAAKELREAVAGLRKAPRDERERIATYFDEIAACLREIAKRVEAGDAPGDTCARLAVYAEELEDIIGSHDSLRASRDESVEQTRKRLGAALNRAQSDWAMLAETSDEKLWLYASGQWKQDEPSRAGELVWEDIAAADRVRGGADSAAQPVWDAAGEFTALAATFRAR
jgi:hypothetical protein